MEAALLGHVANLNNSAAVPFQSDTTCRETDDQARLILLDALHQLKGICGTDSSFSYEDPQPDDTKRKAVCARVLYPQGDATKRQMVDGKQEDIFNGAFMLETQ